MKFKTTLESNFTLIDLTPLVDVIFLMLIFFMVTSDILPLKSLNIEHPKIELSTSPRTTQILVVMDAAGVIYVGSKKEIVDFNGFKEAIKEEIESKKAHGAQTTIVLSIDKSIDYGSFLRLFALAQETKASLRLVYQDTSKKICSY
jgi:biopolymer transport protein ExbD